MQVKNENHLSVEEMMQFLYNSDEITLTYSIENGWTAHKLYN